MSQKINPYAWRLGRNEKYKAIWMPTISDYSIYSTKISLLRQYLERYYRDIVEIEVLMDNIYKGQLNLKFLKMEDLNKGLVLKNIKSWTSRKLNLKLNINALFYDKRELNCWSIGQQIRNHIESRMNPFSLISHFLKAAENDSKIKGLRIIIKGRWKASNKTKKQISQYGSTKVQSIDTPVEYAAIDGVGKFGCFCVRVFLSRDV